jgi:Putative oxidoreductase C terminal domain
MKKIIEENHLTVMATIARYACAYQAIAKHEWWDKAIWLGTVALHFYEVHLTLITSVRGGPIIEQGTHFCDLSRYFGGDVDLSTVYSTTLEWDEPAGVLAKVPVDESKVKPENRIPRVTSANW